MRTIALITVALVTACNITGHNHAAAEENAKAWAAKASEVVKTDFISCNGIDSDGDGHVSCTFSVNGTIQTFECAGFALVGPHEGCRAPKVHIPTPVNHTTVEVRSNKK